MGTGMLSVPTPFVLFHNALALSHGVTFNPDDIGIIYDPVTDGVSQSRVIQVLMPARNIELRAENGRGCFGSGLYQLQHIPCFALLQRIQEPFIQDQQLRFLQLLLLQLLELVF